LELRRTISSRLGESTIHISDEFTNRDYRRVPLAWLLHINFGYPLLEPEASVYCYRGAVTGVEGPDRFSAGKDFKTAPRPFDLNKSNCQFCAYVDAEADTQGNVCCGIVNRTRNFGVKLEYSRNDYQRLANWQHWGSNGQYMGALEPTNAGV